MLVLTHERKELGQSIGIESIPFKDNAVAWQGILAIVDEHNDSLSQWNSCLLDAIDKGLNPELVLNDGESVLEVAESDDSQLAKEYANVLLGDHNIVGWWLKENIDEDTMTLSDDKNRSVDILSLVDVDIDPSIDLENYAIFFSPKI
jgi:hypothetical protein